MAPSNGSRLLLAMALCIGAVALSSCSQAEPIPEPTPEPSSQKLVSLDNDQLQRKLADFTSSDKNAVVLSDQQLRSTIPKAQEWLESIKVNPSKCGVTFAQPVADQLKNATMAAVEFEGRHLTVAIYKDEQLLRKHWETKNAANEQCSRYSVTANGERRAYHLAEQALDSDADHDEAYVSTSSNGKSTQQQLVVSSSNSNVLIGLQQSTTPSQTKQQIQAAQSTINELLKTLK